MVAVSAVAVVLLVPLSWPRASAPIPLTPPRGAFAPANTEAPDVWLVDKTAESETYSNGLRIDNSFLVATRARSYLAFPADGSRPIRRSEPAGIVFHTTESTQAPFEPDENATLKRIGESTLEYVRRRQAYNFVVDRFGRVYRIVPEDETAHHAGYSAWADANWFYINLNESFIGISFEAVSPGALAPAQPRSAALLIEMLRHRYQIPASDCVTHAQVSVNPSNMRGGFHVDWAGGFPFAAVGLVDNNAAAAPALWGLGFDYDANFRDRAGAPLRAGIESAEAILARKAAAAGLSPAAYKERLRQRYREMLALVRR